MILDNIVITQEEMNKMAREMSHWVQVAKRLYESKDETFILTMLKVELAYRKRNYVANRIYAHFNSIRRRRELAEIDKTLAGIRKSYRKVSEEATEA